MRRLFAIALFLLLSAGSSFAVDQEMPPALKAARMEAALAALDISYAAFLDARSTLDEHEAEVAEAEAALESLGPLSSLNGERSTAELNLLTTRLLGDLLVQRFETARKLLDMRSARFIQTFGEEGEAILQEKYPR